jgi:indolepyruvate ferredoxin oxidoreductase
MAYKDEYEVARLLTKPEVESAVLGMWAKPESLSYNLHPPLLRALGVKKKIQFGPWFRTPLRILAALKFLRGTPLDVFGYLPHRRMERQLISWYRELTQEVLRHWTGENDALAVEILTLPEQIRGYERIKEENVRNVKKRAEEKLAALRLAGTVVKAGG